MTTALLFDFGNVWIDLHYHKTTAAFQALGLEKWPNNWAELNRLFETGQLTERDFLAALGPYTRQATLDQIRQAWNAMISPVPAYRLSFLSELKNCFRLFLVSNTDAIHVRYFRTLMGDAAANGFFNSFERVYFSYEIGIRKPDPAIFKHVLLNSKLDAAQCLFIDDRLEHIKVAEHIGIKSWHLDPSIADVVDVGSVVQPIA